MNINLEKCFNFAEIENIHSSNFIAIHSGRENLCLVAIKGCIIIQIWLRRKEKF